MECEDLPESYPRDRGVPYRVQHHPAAFSAQGVAASEHAPGGTVARVVVVFAGGELVMPVLPAPCRVDPAGAAGVLGEQEVRLAHERELAAAFLRLRGRCDAAPRQPL
jgi:Ala-tRNA(Pro) deacylase